MVKPKNTDLIATNRELVDKVAHLNAFINEIIMNAAKIYKINRNLLNFIGHQNNHMENINNRIVHLERTLNTHLPADIYEKYDNLYENKKIKKEMNEYVEQMINKQKKINEGKYENEVEV